MNHLSIDIETRSDIDIGKAGAYRYAQSPEFGLLLFAFQWGGGDVGLVDLACGEPFPADLKDALKDPAVVKHAYNAAFEWCCLNQAGYGTPVGQWRCTMAHGLYCGYPAGLEAAGRAVGLPQDARKLSIGRALIRYFCVPCAPTKANGGRRWNLPKHAPEKWDLFKEYCKQDVVAEHGILERLDRFPMPEEEERLWQMDVRMNARGVRVDRELIEGALSVDAVSQEGLLGEAMRLTGLANPNSRAQLLPWLNLHGAQMDNLRKETVEEVLAREDLEPAARRALELRRQLGKTSVTKYVAMEAARDDEDRVHGLIQYYGANRTGRWAGRLVQIHNLPRNHLGTLDEARRLVKRKDYAGLRMVYGNVSDVLSQLIRTAFVPSKGRKFVVADFSAIEARVIAWLAGEQWVNEVFATHGKIYEATAARMFHVPVERIVKGNPEYELRQKGKVATLALGYQGGPNALISQGALHMGLTEEELPGIVQQWRAANPRIRDLWYSVEEAALSAVRTAAPQAVRGLIFALEGDLAYGQAFLTVRLPSGRKLFYPRPYLAENQFGRQALHYHAVGQQTKEWEVASTYGGKLVENLVQAIARDCLAEVLKRAERAGYQVVFHVHDEVIIDAPMGLTVEEVCDLMAEPIPWAPGLILKGAGFEGPYYKKD